MKIKIGLFSFLLLLCQSVYSQTFADGYYRLTTQVLGNIKSLDVVNDGNTNSKLQLANTGNFSGQHWKISSLGNGYYRLTTEWLGETKSLDVVNDGTNNKLQLATTSGAAGQFWKITSVGNGFYRLTTRWLGETKSLDVVNDGQNNKVQLSDSGDFLGQYWKIADISLNNSANTIVKIDEQFKNIYLSGFKINIREKLAETDEARETLQIISAKLSEMGKILKPPQLEKLKKVPIWIQYKIVSDKAMWYHPNKVWLINNGYPAELEKSIEINNVRHFIDWQNDQPFMILHEFAHAYEDLYLGEMQNKIVEAYNNAVSSGKYENVSYIRGGKQRAYALNNKTEYFAELTEAYFGKNDYYPFERKDLKEFDPTGYKLMQTIWE